MMGRGQRGPNPAGYGYGPVSTGLNPGYDAYNYGPGPRPSQRFGENGIDYHGRHLLKQRDGPPRVPLAWQCRRQKPRQLAKRSK